MDPITIPIIDAVMDLGKTVIDKIWMGKADKEKLEMTKDEMRRAFEVTLTQMEDTKQMKVLENTLKEHQAQRDYANAQFGTVEALSNMGWVGKTILLGRAGIRWVITGGSMYFTWEILNAVLTDGVINGLATGTLGGSAPYIVGLLITLIVAVPLFYCCGVSVEKILDKRNKL